MKHYKIAATTGNSSRGFFEKEGKDDEEESESYGNKYCSFN